MAKRMNDPKPKPMEEWTGKEWEIAYASLNARFDKLRDAMRKALGHLGRAQEQLASSIA